MAIFITVFLDMLSFGIFIPDISVRGDALGARDVVRGLLIAIFSIASLIFSPILGRWSDRVGRRKVLLVSTVITILSYVAYGFSTALPMMFLSRILGGLGGANIGVAYAYVADVTKPEERAKGMGIIGAAFGMGFVFGPPLGIALLVVGKKDPMWLGLGGTLLALVNLLFIYLYVRDTETNSDQKRTEFSLGALWQALRLPGLGVMLAIFFSYNFAFSNLESTYMLLAVKQFGWPQEQAGLVLVLVGVVMAAMQGYFIGVLTPKFGELKLLRVGFLIVAPVIALVPFALPFGVHLLGVIALGIGSGLASPSLGSLVSRNAPATMQGGIFGITQGLGAFARILGPLVANSLFDIRYFWPYLLAGIIMVLPVLGSWFVRPGESGTPDAGVPVH